MQTSTEYHLAVISAKRAVNVPAMQERVGPAVWYVPDADVEDYEKQGAASVVGCGLYGNLSASRNAALEDAFTLNKPCVQSDDDLTKIERVFSPSHSKSIGFPAAVRLMLDRLKATPYKLGAVAPTSNRFFYTKPISTQVFCIASLCVVLPDDIRFDETIPLKEDYDFTLQHISRHGGVVRSDDLLAFYKHYSNKGGAVGYRNDKTEQAAIAILRRKWGNAIRTNPRRENEILLKVKV